MTFAKFHFLDLQLRRSPVHAVEYNPPAAKQARREPPTNITPFGALESFQYYDPPQALSAGKVSMDQWCQECISTHLTGSGLPSALFS